MPHPLQRFYRKLFNFGQIGKNFSSVSRSQVHVSMMSNELSTALHNFMAMLQNVVTYLGEGDIKWLYSIPVKTIVFLIYFRW